MPPKVLFYTELGSVYSVALQRKQVEEVAITESGSSTRSTRASTRATVGTKKATTRGSKKKVYVKYLKSGIEDLKCS